MQIWQAIVLGVAQGLTEFLPVSSSGHLMLLERLFGIQENGLLYSVFMHLGTLVPVCIVFFRQILDLFKNPKNKLVPLILATLPAGVVGLAVGVLVDLDNLFICYPWLLSITFLLTAIELFVCQRIENKRLKSKALNNKRALIMGVGQALAVFPGLSRSGTVIFSGSLAGVNREENASFTFLMSVPIIVSAVLLEGGKAITMPSVSVDLLPLVFGVVSAGVFGYISVAFTIKIIKSAKYNVLSIYLTIVAVINAILGVV